MILKLTMQLGTRIPLEGAKFEFRTLDGEMSNIYTTDSNGKIVINDIPSGNYTLKEVEAPKDYILDDTPQDFEIIGNQFVKLVFENTTIGSLNIKKVDADTKEPLKGVEFEVRTIEKTLIGTYKTNKNGMIYISGLADGYYTITETKPLDGYASNKEPQIVEVKSGETKLVEIENTKLSGLRIYKIDSVTRKGIYSVEFMVFDTNGSYVDTYYTDNNGIVDIVDLFDKKSYVIRETRPAKNYK